MRGKSLTYRYVAHLVFPVFDHRGSKTLRMKKWPQPASRRLTAHHLWQSHRCSSVEVPREPVLNDFPDNVTFRSPGEVLTKVGL